MASYAKQANNHELENIAKRIRARAIRQGGILLKEIDASYKRNRDLWMNNARKEFKWKLESIESEHCAVCGKYKMIVEGHHTTPLYLQFKAGFDRAIHDYEWLCPNHHKLVHLYLSNPEDLRVVDSDPDFIRIIQVAVKSEIINL